VYVGDPGVTVAETNGVKESVNRPDIVCVIDEVAEDVTDKDGLPDTEQVLVFVTHVVDDTVGDRLTV